MNPVCEQRFFQNIGLEWGWAEPLVKVAKNYNHGVVSLYIYMRNVIVITTSSKEILETTNSFKILQNWEISWQNRRSGGWGGSFPGRVGRNGTNLSTIYQLSHLSTFLGNSLNSWKFHKMCGSIFFRKLAPLKMN